jgi:hypothetical protein
VQQLPTLTPRNYYNLACYRALLAEVATEAGAGVTAEEGKATAEQAMASLRQAIAAGFGSVARVRSDTSLDTLRPREDFQKLAKELEATKAAHKKTEKQP